MRTRFLYFPLILLGLFVAPPPSAGQTGDHCWACARVRCQPTGTEYRRCTEAVRGSTRCRQGPGRCGSCDDSVGRICSPTVASADDAEDALDAFAHGRMLPAKGNYFVGVKGKELVLRLKCGGTPVARLAVADVGFRSRVVEVSA